METKLKITRRQILVAIPAVLVGSSGQSIQLGIDRILEIYTDETAAITVGNAYLRSHAGTLNEICVSVVQKLGIESVLPNRLSVSELRRHCNGVIRQDFARGDVGNFDGWVLSLTEAQICAIYSLAG